MRYYCTLLEIRPITVRVRRVIRYLRISVEHYVPRYSRRARCEFVKFSENNIAFAWRLISHLSVPRRVFLYYYHRRYCIFSRRQYYYYYFYSYYCSCCFRCLYFPSSRTHVRDTNVFPRCTYYTSSSHRCPSWPTYVRRTVFANESMAGSRDQQCLLYA